MNDEAVETMFRAMSEILNNQQKIMRHMAVIKEYGCDDEQLEDIIRECDNLAYRYSHEE